MPLSGFDRRAVLAAAGWTGAAAALALPAPGAPPSDAIPRRPLWPDGPPGRAAVTVTEATRLRQLDSPPDDVAITHVVTPTLSRLRPEHPNGASLLLIPGGGYREVAIGLEGDRVARQFAALGYDCSALVYRQPPDGWPAGAAAPLQDAQRALRTVRAAARRDGLDPDRIAVIGFSAGGHLAAWLTLHGAGAAYPPADAIDREPLGATATALLYPVITLDGPYAHAGSRRQLLGDDPDPAHRAALSMEQAVAVNAPPTFLAHALDDRAVPFQNSVMMTEALHARGIAAECHLFERGGHGFGLGAPGSAAAAWPALCAAFLRRHGA